MKSPIGLFLAEFRTDAPLPALVPESAEHADRGADDGELIFARPGDQTPLLPAPAAMDESVLVPVPDEEPLAAAEPPEAVMPDDTAALETALADARLQWAAAEGATLAQAFADALAGFESRVATTLAPMLEPFLVKAAQLRVLADLREALRTLLRGDGTPAVTVTGPADLLAAIEAAFPDEPTLTFAVADTPDVMIAAGDTLVRSRLRAWACVLEDSLGEAA